MLIERFHSAVFVKGFLRPLKTMYRELIHILIHGISRSQFIPQRGSNFNSCFLCVSTWLKLDLFFL